MRILLPLATLVGLSLAGNAALAACPYPKENVSVPDGRTATLDEMKAAQKAVKAFDLAINDYSACIESETNAAIQALPASMSVEDKAKETDKLNRLKVQKINAAVKEDEDTAARFNDQRKIYLEKNKKT